ncbi:MAG: hypothetical protein J0H80_08500, partial [Rhizobiales bacterium]|nr:hypothetical protein [Hyphomicrobiales bacterium]
MRIETRLTQQLGIRHPIILAPMGSAAGGALASAVTNAGGAPQLIQLGELVDARMERGEPAVFRRDGRG